MITARDAAYAQVSVPSSALKWRRNNKLLATHFNGWSWHNILDRMTSIGGLGIMF